MHDWLHLYSTEIHLATKEGFASVQLNFSVTK